MGDRYGRSAINEISIGLSIWNMACRFGIRYIDMVIYHIDMVFSHVDMGDEANDMGDDSIDTVILHIDMGYLVTLGRAAAPHHMQSIFIAIPRTIKYNVKTKTWLSVGGLTRWLNSNVFEGY